MSGCFRFAVKINAVSSPQEDGTSYVYAMYSDVTEQKETEQKLRMTLEETLDRRCEE